MILISKPLGIQTIGESMLKSLILSTMLISSSAFALNIQRVFIQPHSQTEVSQGAYEYVNEVSKNRALETLFTKARESKKYEIKEEIRTVMGYSPYKVQALTLLKTKDAKVIIEKSTDLFGSHQLKIIQSGSFTDVKTESLYRSSSEMGFEVTFEGKLAIAFFNELKTLFPEDNNGSISVEGIVGYPHGLASALDPYESELNCLESVQNYRCSYGFVIKR